MRTNSFVDAASQCPWAGSRGGATSISGVCYQALWDQLPGACASLPLITDLCAVAAATALQNPALVLGTVAVPVPVHVSLVKASCII